MNCGYLIGKKAPPYPRERTSHSGGSYLKELDSTEILCRTFQLLQNISLKFIIQTEFFVYSVTEKSFVAVPEDLYSTPIYAENMK